MHTIDWQALHSRIEAWSRAAGFSAFGISDVDLTQHEAYLKAWLARGFHGKMRYMADHGSMRSHPAQLHPDTLSLISFRMDYLEKKPDPGAQLQRRDVAYISRYALGRDYHKVLRGKLKHIAGLIEDYLREQDFDGQGTQGFQSRVVTDSAPLLEKAIAEKAGLGWIGKNTLLLNEHAGSWFFLGEILTNLPPAGQAFTGTNKPTNRCGSCRACLDICPTHAIVAPYQLDARKCISYLTIELKGAIPVELRKPIGNRVFGCDDCQLACPWNRYAKSNQEGDFKPRHGLDDASLLDLFNWSRQEFLQKTEGSAIRRAGYEGWLRNLAIALGNAPGKPEIQAALKARLGTVSPMVDEHIAWALVQQGA